MIYSKIIFISFYFLSFSLLANERYVCKQVKNKMSPLITNFYIIDDKLIMSGTTGNGEYKVLSKNNTGLLAANSSYIGKDFGLETVLLDRKKGLFIYKLLIKNKNKENITQVKGTCDYFN